VIMQNDTRRVLFSAGDHVDHPWGQGRNLKSGALRGSRIRFLHKALGKSCRVGGRSLPIVIRQAARPSAAAPASIARLAVAMVGTPGKYWPVTNMQPGE
jgi:hypothetical protein